jgi:hypothetical protein
VASSVIKSVYSQQNVSINDCAPFIAVFFPQWLTYFNKQSLVYNLTSTHHHNLHYEILTSYFAYYIYSVFWSTTLWDVIAEADLTTCTEIWLFHLIYILLVYKYILLQEHKYCIIYICFCFIETLLFLRLFSFNSELM